MNAVEDYNSKLEKAIVKYNATKRRIKLENKCLGVISILLSISFGLRIAKIYGSNIEGIVAFLVASQFCFGIIVIKSICQEPDFKINFDENNNDKGNENNEF